MLTNSDLVKAIKGLKNLSDKRRVAKAYDVLFPDAAENRYKNIVSQGVSFFDSAERAKLSKLFVESPDGGYELTTSPEFFELIGEDITTPL